MTVTRLVEVTVDEPSQTARADEYDADLATLVDPLRAVAAAAAELANAIEALGSDTPPRAIDIGVALGSVKTAMRDVAALAPDMIGNARTAAELRRDGLQPRPRGKGRR